MKLNKFYSLNFLKWLLFGLCILVGALCYFFLFSEESILDELTLGASILFGTVMLVGINVYVINPLQILSRQYNLLLSGKKSTNDLPKLKEFETFKSNFNSISKLFGDANYYIIELRRGI